MNSVACCIYFSGYATVFSNTGSGLGIFRARQKALGVSHIPAVAETVKF